MSDVHGQVQQSSQEGSGQSSGGEESPSSQSPSEERSLSDLKVRVAGAAALVVGLALAWWQILAPLYEPAAPGVVRGRAGGVVLGVAVGLPLVGLACILFGKRAVLAVLNFRPDVNDLSPKDIAILAVLIGLFMAVFFGAMIARDAVGLR